MIVYGAILSPFVRKVLIAAAEKGLEVEQRPGGMGQGGDEFVEASPFGKMPAFRVPNGRGEGRDYLLADSSAIVHYLDAAYPALPLIPAEPMARGEVIWLDEFADTILMAAGGKLFFNRVVAPLFLKRPGDLAAADDAERTEIPHILDWLEQRIGPKREFLVGGAFSLADISVAVMFANVRGAGVALDTQKYPNVARWLAGVERRPSFAAQNTRMEKILARVRAEAGA